MHNPVRGTAGPYRSAEGVRMARLTRPQQLDAGIAGVLLVVGVIGTLATDDLTVVDRRVDLLALALVIGAAVATAFRRRRPDVVLAVVSVLVAGYLAIGYPYGPVLFPFFLTVYTAAAYLPLSRTVPIISAALLLLMIHLFSHESVVPGLLRLVPAAAWVVVPFALGVTVRLNREARARDQAEAVRKRVYDERLHIAREVHDVVGHGLVAIKMQADIALHLLAKRPAQAEEALTAISRTATDALEEVRATLAVVRRVDGDPRSADGPGTKSTPSKGGEERTDASGSEGEPSGTEAGHTGGGRADGGGSSDGGGGGDGDGANGGDGGRSGGDGNGGSNGNDGGDGRGGGDGSDGGDGGGGVATGVDRAPVPGLGQLDALRRRMADAGLEVTVETTGVPRRLPAGVDMAGYRVVQESLTNVLRHGSRAIAEVRLAYDTDAVLITVGNPAPGAARGERGFGIAGMAERVAALGGEFAAGPTPDGRFEVRARLPAGDVP